MTHLLEQKSPNPKKVLEVMIAGAIMHAPTDDLEWKRSFGLCTIQEVALTGARVSLVLLQEMNAPGGVINQTVQKYAEDYLMRLYFSKGSFSSSALYLVDELVQSSSPFIDTHTSARRGASWYVVCNCDTAMRLRTQATEEDHHLLPFDRKFSETYRWVREFIADRGFQTSDDKVARFTQLQDEIGSLFNKYCDEKFATET